MAAKITASILHPTLWSQKFQTPDLVRKVTGNAKYAEDYRAAACLFAKLLLSPIPSGPRAAIDASAALAMPGVKRILTEDGNAKACRRHSDFVVRIPAQSARRDAARPTTRLSPVAAAFSPSARSMVDRRRKRSRRHASISSRLPFRVDPLCHPAALWRQRPPKATSGSSPSRSAPLASAACRGC